ncbi:MurR/RpiR family transcriptional regulator [Rhizobium mongolense]|uniref:DNA-binding MurR/RpiR family transcriptional regulator n=2 Tax=Rhizobium mongolense TaxID=57676 RepID=A0ABR6IY70_9HYPH|nr:MurR/RpiR family transcriptional regulator [Rhizobium mongolense]MBB4232867.1 DNA-binding MurR/RpiR family transcriptional regulator [Rhizobium mongolense]TVZ75131.1 RpiR family transcriptional regulator [Rhizobium mongolense USDA 1844]
MDIPVISVIKDSYERFPRQMRVAARWLVDHPIEVALLSMREQARRARVPPATLTRLAKRLGFDGFDELKVVFADNVREQPGSFQDHPEKLRAPREIEGDSALICETVNALDGHLKRFAQPPAIAALSAAADLMVEARQTFCIGRRSSFPVAYLMHYVGSLLGSPTTLIDGIGGASNDALRSIGREDAVLAVTVSPYTRFTLQAAEFAVSRGAKVVALTDSELSPVAKLSEVVIRVRTEMPSFILTMTPGFVAVECLLKLVAARRGDCALQALAANEGHLAEFDTYVV